MPPVPGSRSSSKHPREGDIRFSIPLYTAAEAARAVDVPATTFARWARRGPGSVLTVLPAAGSGQQSIPFVGLAEGLEWAEMRRAGVCRQGIRPARLACCATNG